MKTTTRLTWFASAFLLACSSTTSNVETPAETSTAPATSAAPEDHPPTASSSAAAATPSASSGPTAPAGPEEVAKEANALVLEITVEAAPGGKLEAADADKMKSALIAQIASNPKIAVPSSKGITGNRRVATRLIVDPLVETKDKLSLKVQLNGVTADGKCPLFDLNAKAQMEIQGKKLDASDHDAVRVAAVEQVYKKLEDEAQKMKPNAACTPGSKK